MYLSILAQLVKLWTSYAPHKPFPHLSAGNLNIFGIIWLCRIGLKLRRFFFFFVVDFSSFWWACSKMLTKSFLFKEPVGAVAPKINTGENIQVIRTLIGDGLNILCPAQSFPTPIFRYLRMSVFAEVLKVLLCSPVDRFYPKIFWDNVKGVFWIALYRLV